MPNRRKVYLSVDYREHQGFRSKPYVSSEYSIISGTKRPDKIVVSTNDYDHDEVEVLAWLGNNEDGIEISFPRDKFIAFVQMLNDVFIEGLEYTKEDVS